MNKAMLIVEQGAVVGAVPDGPLDPILIEIVAGSRAPVILPFRMMIVDEGSLVSELPANWTSIEIKPDAASPIYVEA